MTGCVGAGMILFGGLFVSWILFDYLDMFIGLYVTQTNSMSIAYKSFNDLIVYSAPLLVLFLSFVMAYTYMQRKRREK